MRCARTAPCFSRLRPREWRQPHRVAATAAAGEGVEASRAAKTTRCSRRPSRIALGSDHAARQAPTPPLRRKRKKRSRGQVYAYKTAATPAGVWLVIFFFSVEFFYATIVHLYPSY